MGIVVRLKILLKRLKNDHLRNVSSYLKRCYLETISKVNLFERANDF